MAWNLSHKKQVTTFASISLIILKITLLKSWYKSETQLFHLFTPFNTTKPLAPDRWRKLQLFFGARRSPWPLPHEAETCRKNLLPPHHVKGCIQAKKTFALLNGRLLIKSVRLLRESFSVAAARPRTSRFVAENFSQKKKKSPIFQPPEGTLRKAKPRPGERLRMK